MEAQDEIHQYIQEMCKLHAELLEIDLAVAISLQDYDKLEDIIIVSSQGVTDSVASKWGDWSWVPNG